jgi:hypothetical protein
MQVLDYSCRVFLAALSSAVARANFIISVIMVIAGAAIWFAPSLGMTIDASELITMLRSPAFLTALVGGVILFRLVGAQYWVWTEEHNARIKAESQVADLSQRYVQLSVGDLYSVQNSSPGAVSWRIKIRNAGASAANVHMNLCDISPRPRSQFWDADYPYRVVQVGHTLDSNECHIHRSGDAIFELTRVEPAAHNTGFLTTLNTRPGSHQVKIEPDERWEKMEYVVTAKNADALKFILRMYANTNGVTFDRIA